MEKNIFPKTILNFVKMHSYIYKLAIRVKNGFTFAENEMHRPESNMLSGIAEKLEEGKKGRQRECANPLIPRLNVGNAMKVPIGKNSRIFRGLSE